MSDESLVSPLSEPLLNNDKDENDAVMSSKPEKTKGEELSLPSLGKTRFNILFFKRLAKILRILFPSILSKTLGFFILFLVFRSAAEYNYYNTGLIPSKFYGSLTSRNSKAFWESIYQSLIIVTSACVCKSSVELMANIIYVRWRSLLTSHLHKHYFDRLNYYKLNVLYKVVDNPDQRITQDVDKFCNDLATQILPKLVLWPFIVSYYTYKTYVTVGYIGVFGVLAISGAHHFFMGSWQYMVSLFQVGYIGVLAIYGLFIVATIINKFLMGPVISLIVTQEKREGDFRFHHVEVRTNAESIAFYDGGVLERIKARELMGKLLKTLLDVAHWTFPLNLSVNLFDYLSSIVTYIVLGIIIFSGGYDNLSASGLSREISEVSFFSLYLLNNFSTLVDQSNNVADLAGYTHRIGHLLEVVYLLKKNHDTNDDDNENDVTKSPHLTNNDDSSIIAVSVEDITIARPDVIDIPLIEGLNFQLEKGRNILISGPSGCGKSSILRVIKRLWTPLRGRAIISEPVTGVMFLPQKPHLTIGSLADQVVYPQEYKEDNAIYSSLDSILDGGRIDEALKMAGLVHIKERLGGINIAHQGKWSDYVSPGEMQKIAFARIFYHRPSYAVLDESTSSLSEEDEHYFYTKLQEIGITFLSIGHRSTIQQYHQLVLTISGNGQWSLGSIL